MLIARFAVCAGVLALLAALTGMAQDGGEPQSGSPGKTKSANEVTRVAQDPSRSRGPMRFTISAVDEHDPEAAYEWARGRCRRLDLQFLADEYDVAADRPAVAEAIAATFPSSSRERAHSGCLDGFRLQDRDGGPMPPPPAS